MMHSGISIKNENKYISVGDTGASCVERQVVSEAFYENIAHLRSHHR